MRLSVDFEGRYTGYKAMARKSKRDSFILLRISGKDNLLNNFSDLSRVGRILGGRSTPTSKPGPIS